MQAEKFQSLIFRARLAHRLEERGMTQLALAKAAGVSHATISNYLRGARTSPRAEEVLAMARVLEVTMEWLLGAGEESDKPTLKVGPGALARAEQPSPLCAVPEAELRDLVRRLREQADQLEKHYTGSDGKGGE